MREEILNLLDFASGVMTETSARTPKVMRRNTGQAATAEGGRNSRPDYFRTERIRRDPALLMARNVGPEATATAVSPV